MLFGNAMYKKNFKRLYYLVNVIAKMITGPGINVGPSTL